MIDRYKRHLDEFLFASVNPSYAALFRIGLALMIVVVFLLPHARGGFAVVYMRELGSPLQDILLGKPYLIVSLLVAIIFGAGFYPRIVGFLLAVIIFPLIFILGFHVSRQILLFSLIAFSLVQSDMRLGLNRNTSNLTLGSGPIWPIRLIQIQLSVLYGINAIAKTTPEFLSGDVLKGMSIISPNFLVNLSEGYLHVGFLAIPTVLLAISSMLIEYILSIGFWFRRTRMPTAILGIIFHLVLTKIIRIGLLDWTAIFLYLAFLIPFERPVTKAR